MSEVKALVHDVFGTVVDWRSAVIADGEALGARKGITADWARFADSWRGAPGAYPLSLSMPLAAAEHPHAAIDAFLWGLLPDNEFVVRRWAQRYHVSPRNAFAAA